MAFTSNGDFDARGARVEFGSFTLNPASASAGATVDATVTVSGVVTTDQIFVKPRDIEDGLIVTGAVVSDTDEITVRVYNPTGSPVDGGEQTYDILILHVAT